MTDPTAATNGEKTIGLDFGKFEEDSEEIIKLIASRINDNQTSYSINRKSKKLLIFFDSKEDADKFKTQEFSHKSVKVKLSDTVQLSKEIINISIPSFEGMSFNKFVKAIKKIFLPIGTVYDFTVLVDKNDVKINNNAKLIFKKNPDCAIPPFLYVDNAVLSLYYKDAPTVLYQQSNLKQEEKYSKQQVEETLPPIDTWHSVKSTPTPNQQRISSQNFDKSNNTDTRYQNKSNRFDLLKNLNGQSDHQMEDGSPFVHVDSRSGVNPVNNNDTPPILTEFYSILSNIDPSNETSNGFSNKNNQNMQYNETNGSQGIISHPISHIEHPNQ
ncbi:hypothetical protein BB558_006073 [Smittium angustum]|uniref:Uncharacterized protein n=1 Tax=Smittium angustum TaxID=133377 RepID=A0A2U1IYQ6_SMIAN|nr:hypothetical protein BB558_006834 [Smittium angustum]PVZ97950.1 hypothetical protein BB558_006073 [Smittium angustum]